MVYEKSTVHVCISHPSVHSRYKHRNENFIIITQRVVVITDVAGQPTSPIFMGQESYNPNPTNKGNSFIILCEEQNCMHAANSFSQETMHFTPS